jgi:hypothetical protein
MMDERVELNGTCIPPSPDVEERGEGAGRI